MLKYIYYSIWADVINYEKIKNGGEEHWKIFTFSYMTLLLSFNFLSIFTAIASFTGWDVTSFIMNYLVKIIHNESIINVVWAFKFLFIPSALVNYFFVFYKKNYNFILKKYPFKNGKYLLIYFFLTIVFFWGLIFFNSSR